MDDGFITREPGSGRVLFTQPCTFVAAGTSVEALPPPILPEVAFAGRSNCGKSSLINALTGRRNLARASRTPGRTRSINLFCLGGRVHLVDLPGYGYAQASKSDVSRWTRAVEDYLAGRPVLRRVCLLLDARRGVTARDRETFDHLDSIGAAYQVVVTKSDKVRAAGLERVAGEASDELGQRPAAFPRIAVTSARKGWGLEALRDDLAVLARTDFSPDSPSVGKGPVG